MAQLVRTSVGTLVDRLTDRLGNNSVFWTAQEKLDAVNEAILVWHSMTGEFNKILNIIVDSSVFYTVPHQLMSITRVLYAGVPLAMTSVWELDFSAPGWPATTGTPYCWAPVGIDKFIVYPIPASGTITVEGYMEFPRQNVGDFLQMGDEDIEALLAYAQHYCAFKEGGKEFVATVALFQKFLGATALRNKQITATNSYQNFMGEHRDEGQRPPRAGDDERGIRG